MCGNLEIISALSSLILLNLNFLSKPSLKARNIFQSSLDWPIGWKDFVDWITLPSKLTKVEDFSGNAGVGNTTSATLPLLLYDFEKKLKKGDNLIFAAFGGGFTWGSIYLLSLPMLFQLFCW